jgi:glycosyltransferase involved in cell wall biosynthesis
LPLVRASYAVALWIVSHLPASVLRVLKEHWAYRLRIEPVLADLRPDIVHAHDLGTLYAGAQYCRATGAALVYDAHELELARRRKLDLFGRTVDRRVERAGIRSAAAVITVSEGIARELARVYEIEPPNVVLNSPSLRGRSMRASVSLREAAGLEPDDMLAVYVGKVVNQKVGLERLIRALGMLPYRFHVGLLGPPAAPPVRDALDALARRLGVSERLHWFAAVPYEQVPAVLSTATCSIVPIQNVHRSYDLALPNKLFDSIMAGVPVGVARLHEMQRLVTTHEIGVVFDERKPRDIATALIRLEELSRDPSGDLASKFARLQPEISWERQERILLELYGRLKVVT